MKGFLGAEFFAVFVDASYVKDNHAANRTLQMIDTVRTDVIAAHPTGSSSPPPRRYRARPPAEKNRRLMGIEAATPSRTPSAARDYYASASAT